MSKNNQSYDIDIDPSLEIKLDRKIKVQVVTVHGLGKENISLVEHLSNNLYNCKNFGKACLQSNAVIESLNKTGAFKKVSMILDTENGPTMNDNYLLNSFIVDKPSKSAIFNRNNDDSIPISIRIDAQKLRWISGKIGTYFGNKDNTLNASINFNNIGSMGNFISLIASHGQNTKASFEIIYSKIFSMDPDKRLSFYANKHSTDFNHCSFKETSHTVGTKFITKSDLGDHIYGCKIQLRNNCDYSSNASLYSRLQAGFSMKYSVDHQFTNDSRNDSNFPSSGYLLKLYKELSSSSEFANYLKFEGNFQYFYEIFRNLNMVFSPSFSYGIIHSFGGSNIYPQIPINDRFFIGGPLNIRGFISKSIGNVARNDFIGGDIYWMMASHLIFRLPNTSESEGIGSNIRGHLFACAGDIRTKTENQSTSKLIGDLLRSFNTCRYSIGLGIIINITGSAKLELNLIAPFGKNSDNYRRGLQFGIGMDFL